MKELRASNSFSRKIATAQTHFGAFACLLIFVFLTQNLFGQYSNSRSGGETKDSKVKVVKLNSAPKNENTAPRLVNFTEGFDDGIIPAGWSIQNLSTTIGTNADCWNIFTGATPWSPQAGTGHIGATFNCTAGENTISGWLFSPQITFVNGDQIRFWTRKGSPDQFPDRLELRLSTNGASTDAGTTATSVGDFTTLLLSVNPTLVTDVYPTVYTQFTATISGLGGATNGRVAFRYFVTEGGPLGDNSDIISIDTFEYLMAPLAAGVNIGGRIANSNGNGISGARVSMTKPSGEVLIIKTNAFGYYKFEDLEVGATYTIQVADKRHQFANPTQVITLEDAVEDLNFTALP